MATDGELAALEGHARRIEESAAATTTARQSERDARTQHEAATRAVQPRARAFGRAGIRWCSAGPLDSGPRRPMSRARWRCRRWWRPAAEEQEAAYGLMREATGRVARLEVQLGEFDGKLATIDKELGQTQTEPLPPLTPEREHALVRLTGVDRAAAPLYRASIWRVKAAVWARPSRGCWNTWTC